MVRSLCQISKKKRYRDRCGIVKLISFDYIQLIFSTSKEIFEKNTYEMYSF